METPGFDRRCSNNIGECIAIFAVTLTRWNCQLPYELSARPGFRLGWVCMEDDAEIHVFYDRDVDSFGYALNLDCAWCSEWGYSPF